MLDKEQIIPGGYFMFGPRFSGGDVFPILAGVNATGTIYPGDETGIAIGGEGYLGVSF
ncbi:MAG: hypothetical protein ABH871_04840 [Pseudomonadota bacterium]